MGVFVRELSVVEWIEFEMTEERMENHCHQYELKRKKGNMDPYAFIFVKREPKYPRRIYYIWCSGYCVEDGSSSGREETLEKAKEAAVSFIKKIKKEHDRAED